MENFRFQNILKAELDCEKITIEQGVQIIKKLDLNDWWIENEIRYALEKNEIKKIQNTNDGQTPLHYLARDEDASFEIIKYLVRYFLFII